MRSETEFKKVEALQLSFKNILQIQNLLGFDSLTKLQLDNNIIEKIENLGPNLFSIAIIHFRRSPPNWNKALSRTVHDQGQIIFEVGI